MSLRSDTMKTKSTIFLLFLFVILVSEFHAFADDNLHNGPITRRLCSSITNIEESLFINGNELL